MASMDNPAGRLHNLLSEFNGAAQDGRTFSQAWGEVFGARPSSSALFRRVGAAAALLDDIVASFEAIGDQDSANTARHYTKEWAKAFFPNSVGFGSRPSGADRALTQDALLTLGTLSGYLSRVASEGRDVPEDERRDLSEQLEAVIQTVHQDEEMDGDLRGHIIRLLRDIQRALDEYRIGGPGAVLKACKVLGAEIVLDDAHDGESRFPEKMKEALVEALKKVWVTFVFVDTTYGAITVGESVYQLLGH